ncbi:MAG: A/G-specific adenine glycosylase, partial [Planctomycetota bacterium]
MTRRNPPPPAQTAIRRKLLRWYDLHKRDLPWRRRADDPYAQWVAEIMLQQTRVETVRAQYERFLRRFPTIGRLARADHEDVLKHWEGLGYYRRILHLHRAARMVCENGGVIPDNAEALRALPGVGEYTAAAIASIAFNRPEAAVDGNVARVLSRLFGVTQDVRSPVGKSRIRDLARSLLSQQRPGDFNQAWMDLGSLVCTPKAPRCDACPLRAHCLAAENGDPEFYPVREAARNRIPKTVSLVVAIFVREGKMLVRRRERGGLWSGLWEFPTLELPFGAQPLRYVR